MSFRHDFISGLTSSNAPNEKVNNAAALLYPESMYDDWQERLAALDIPCAYCIHDKDMLADCELDRKIHVHVFLRFDQNTTLRYIKRLMETLCDTSKTQEDGSPVKSCCMPVCKINNPRQKYDYLIHHTKASANKYQYSVTDRIEINGFDIGRYEKLTDDEKKELLEEIIGFVMKNNITCFGDLRSELLLISDPTEDDPDNTQWNTWKNIVQSYHAYIGQFIKGNYGKKVQSLEREIEKLKGQQ